MVMKKNIALAIAVTIILFFIPLQASVADNGIVINPIRFIASDNALEISGSINSSKDRIPVTLYIETGGKVIALDETLAVGKENGAVVFAFEPVMLDVATPSGEFTVTVSASFVNKKASVKYSYQGADVKYAALKALQNALDMTDAKASKAAFKSALENYAEILGADYDYLTALDTKGEDSVLSCLMSKKQYTLPEGYDTKEDCVAVQKAVNEFGVLWNEAAEIGDFFSLTSADALKAWYEKNKEPYDLQGDDTDTEEDESKMVSYLEDAVKSSKYLNRRADIPAVSSMKELSGYIKHQALLHRIENSNQYAVTEIVKSFPKLFEDIDYSRYNSLSDADKTTVAKSLASKAYATIDGFVKAFNNALENLGSKKSGGSGGSSGGSGSSKSGSSGSGGTGAFTAAASSASNDRGSVKFTDIDHVAWAGEAIRGLYAAGVISGRTPEIFAPDDNINRAEFVKMLVYGLKKDTLSAGSSFNDVNEDDWFYQSVGAASSLGWVKGDENGNFCPDAPITRQDAVVILYRVLDADGTWDNAGFADFDSVSDYAKDAVNYMAANGVVNGMGNGRFAPLEPLSRAQAAKILYQALKI